MKISYINVFSRVGLLINLELVHLDTASKTKFANIFVSISAWNGLERYSLDFSDRVQHTFLHRVIL